MNRLVGVIFVLLVIFNIVRSDEDPCSVIKKRRKWGASPPLTLDYQTIPVKYVIIQHTVTPTCSTYSDCSSRVKNIQDYHMVNLRWPDIGYNFLVGNDGNVYEGAGWHTIGGHTYGYNNKSIGIAFIGNFDDELPTRAALNAAKKLLQCGVNEGELNRRYRLLAARQVTATVSPGKELFDEIQDWDNWAASP